MPRKWPTIRNIVQKPCMGGHGFNPIDRPLHEFIIEECLTKRANEKNIVIWGDSLAAHYVFGLRQFGPKAGINFLQVTAGACPPIFDFDAHFFNPNCRAFNDGVRLVIGSKKPDAMILSASWSAYVDHYGHDVVFKELRKTVLRLTNLGVQVILFGPSIEYRKALPGLLAKFACLVGF